VLVAATHQLKEQHRAGTTDREIADFVDDHERGKTQRADATRELPTHLRVFERGNEIGERRVVHAAAAFRGGNRETDGEMRLAHAGRPEEDDIFMALEKTEGMQAFDLLALDRGLKGEIKIGERLPGRDPAPAGAGRPA